MVGKPKKIYQFGPFRLDVIERLLLRDGGAVVLTPKVFDLLALLVENHGHLLEKERLLKELWPDSFVEEANLNVNISALRRALGESPTDSHFIETVPRRGYRFVAEVREIDGTLTRNNLPNIDVFPREGVGIPVPANVAETTLSLSESVKPPRRLVLWSMGIFILIVAVSLASWRFDNRPADAAAPVKTVAVLPFRPLAGVSDPALEIGMADALITRLTNSRQIIVRPTSSVLKYSGSETDALAAGRALAVDAVLVGRIQRADNRIRVTVQLLKVNGGDPVWAETFDDYFTNIFAVQDSISEKMADALAMHLTSSAKELMTKRATESTEAYQLYMQGRYLHFKYQFEEALKYFEAAVEKDPEYPLAYTGLAVNYAALAITKPESRAEFTEKAVTTANKAVNLDPELDEAHNALGWVKFSVQWDWVGAEQHFRRAIQLNANHSQAHINYGTLLSFQGKHNQAIEESELALRLDPSSSDVYYNYVMHLYHARRYEDALALSQKALQVDPEHPYWIWVIPRIYLAQGRFDEAIREVQKRMKGDELKRSIIIGYAYAQTGRKREAEAILKAALNKSGKPMNGSIALLYMGLDDKERALDWLETGYQQRDNVMTHLKVEPLFDPLRSHPRFQELLRRMHLE